jgi:hypothetical protein
MQTSEGGCLCSSVRYRVTCSPSSSLICHCQTCRKASAAPSVGWLVFERAKFTLLAGTPRRYQSSPGVVRTYCGNCGTSLTYENDEGPDTIEITTVSMDNPALFPPTREVWREHKVPWEATNKALDQYPRGTSDGPYPGA